MEESIFPYIVTYLSDDILDPSDRFNPAKRVRNIAILDIHQFVI